MQAVAKNKTVYDLSRFDRTEAKKQTAEKKTKTATRSHAKAKTSVSGFAMFCAVTVFVMLAALLFSYVNLTEASDINRKRKVLLSELQEETQMLEVNRNQRMGALQVRDYAVTKLGMSKMDKSQITYVSTSGGDRFEVVGKEEKEPSRLVTGLIKGFSTVVEYIN
ncbi:MAG: hypothetical protein IKU65_06005 [Oscillospiraceae bacterium]|nr:hypothetical protein [Oscillospiraceae bacterium]